MNYEDNSVSPRRQRNDMRRQFGPLSVALPDKWVQLPARGFVLVLYSNHSHKMHRFELRA